MVNIHKPFHQKYRPNNLGELVGQDIISSTLKQALLSKKIAPAYLFSGPRGTGKTSSARILAKSLNCLNHNEPNPNPCNQCELCKNISEGIALDIIEIDAASNTGVENIRDIIERARFAPTQARWKVYVIDECHMLSTAASNALLKTIEEPPTNVVFILATTNPERVLNTIQSRCQRYDFRRINNEAIYKHLLDIAKRESIVFENNAIKLISKRANGGMRDAQSLLDQLSLMPNGITKKNVEQLLGEVSENDLIDLINSLINNDPERLITSCAKLYDLGNEPREILEGLLNVTRDLLLKSKNDDYSELFYTSEDFYPTLTKIAELINKSRVIGWHKKLKNIEYQIKTSNQPRLWLEVNLTSLLEIHDDVSNRDENSNNRQKIISSSRLNNHDKQFSQNNNPKENNESIKEENQATDHTPNPEVKTNSKFTSKSDQDLAEKWTLILTKIELPSTRMLLSQQAKLVGIFKDSIEISLAPNWENMIKSRKPLIDDAVKQIFGNKMKINFISERDFQPNSDAKLLKTNKNESKKNEKTEIIESQTQLNKDNHKSENTKSPENLANFFNGEIIDFQD